MARAAETKGPEQAVTATDVTTTLKSSKIMTTTEVETTESIVTISYHDLVDFSNNDNEAIGSSSSNHNRQRPLLLVDQIGLAFGNDHPESSLGILLVVDLPPPYAALRQTLLPMAHALAHLEDEELEKLVDKESGYQVGWSHGKEKLEGHKLDVGKGSFYANPLTDDVWADIQSRRTAKDIGAMVQANDDDENDNENDACATGATASVALDPRPSLYAPNVWPNSSNSNSSSLALLEPTFKRMGSLVCQVGRLLAKVCDAYVASKCKGYEAHKLETILKTSLHCKARLLHYFPATVSSTSSSSSSSTSNRNDKDVFSDWCGWHNDHGSLTGLVPAMYLDDETGKPITASPMDNDDSGDSQAAAAAAAGLYIRARNGRLVHVKLPSTDDHSNNCLAFQIGETAQVHTGGILQATPHAVRGVCSSAGSLSSSKSKAISRESFAVFMEPELNQDMDLPVGKTVEDIQKQTAHLPKTVKTLQSRWRPGQTFGDFSQATFQAFY